MKMNQIEIDDLFIKRERDFLLIELKRILFEAQMISTCYLNRVGTRDKEIASVTEKICIAFREVKELRK